MYRHAKLTRNITFFMLAAGLMLGLGQFVKTTEQGYGKVVDKRPTTGQYFDCNGVAELTEGCGSCDEFPSSTPDWGRYCEHLSSHVLHGFPFKASQPFTSKTLANLAIFVLPPALLVGLVMLSQHRRTKVDV